MRAKEQTDHSSYLNSTQASSGHQVKPLTEPKWYLDTHQLDQFGSRQFKLYVPPYSVDQIQEHIL